MAKLSSSLRTPQKTDFCQKVFRPGHRFTDMSTNLVVARQALEEGNLRQADAALETIAPTDINAATLRAETLFLRGYCERALKLGEDTLRRIARTAEESAELLFVTGACSWELGDEAAGMQRLERAAAKAGETENWSLLSRIQLQMLERSAGHGEPY